MVKLRCTPPLLRFLQIPVAVLDRGTTSRLGDWSGTVLSMDRKRVALCLNDRTQFPLLLPLEGEGLFLGRFRQAVGAVIAEFADDLQVIWAEMEALLDIQVAPLQDKTTERALSRLVEALGAPEQPVEMDLEKEAWYLPRRRSSLTQSVPEEVLRTLLQADGETG